MDDEEEDEEIFFCDDCGEEFPTQASLEGHEAAGCWAQKSEED
jgi:hypothetical protein